uniref:Uncharacterized protein n=1 Tax=Loa loa TaxID=7209 RepID=A0A1I7VQ47_LOALO
MESTLPVSIIIKIASICLQICAFTGITVLLITTCCKKGSAEESETDVRGSNLSSFYRPLLMYTSKAHLCKAVQTFHIIEQSAPEVRNLKPKVSREIMKSSAQRRAIAKIREGQMTPASEGETVDDAISNWGNVQKVEGDHMVCAFCLCVKNFAEESENDE